MQRFRGGLVFEARRLCVSLNSRLESNKEEDEILESGAVLVERGTLIPLSPVTGALCTGLPRSEETAPP